MTAPVRSAEIKVRRARATDGSQLAGLCGQLGYPSSVEEVSKRLAGIEPAAEHVVFVAETHSGVLQDFCRRL